VTRERPGQLTGEFLMLYAVVRIVGEIFREPDAPLLFGLSRGTFYSCSCWLRAGRFSYEPPQRSKSAEDLPG